MTNNVNHNIVEKCFEQKKDQVFFVHSQEMRQHSWIRKCEQTYSLYFAPTLLLDPKDLYTLDIFCVCVCVRPSEITQNQI